MCSSQARFVEIDAFKGVLICLIVLGHNTLFSAEFPLQFRVLYNFHVACFLLLPCIFFGQSVQGLQVADRLVRYGVPHILFFLLACVLYFYFFVPGNAAAVQEWLGTVLIALLFSSEETYNTAVGLRLFWFLPALLSLLFLRSLFFSLEQNGRRLFLVIVLLVHAFLGLVPKEYLPYIPYGLPLVLFLFPVGLLAGILWKHFNGQTGFWLASLLIFVAAVWLGVHFDSYESLAGDPRVFSVFQPVQLIFHDIYLVSAFFGLIALMRFSPQFIQKAFAYVGERSLPIFLLHSFIWQGYLRIGLVAWFSDHLQPSLAVICAFLTTLATATLISLLLETSKSVYRFVFPRDRNDWRFGASRHES
jgi:fucose 4-O-acetylase-like acetyltransferase